MRNYKLEKIGLDTPLTDKKVRIVTASGIVYAPKIKVDWFSCLGQTFKSFPIVVHTLPPGLSAFGLLGIDFLRQAKVRIDLFDRSVSLRK
jgi:predicted aspartyl protease